MNRETCEILAKDRDPILTKLKAISYQILNRYRLVSHPYQQIQICYRLKLNNG